MARKGKQASGGARLVASGREPILLGVEKADKKKIRAAARKEKLYMTQFILRHALAAAERILAEKGNSH